MNTRRSIFGAALAGVVAWFVKPMKAKAPASWYGFGSPQTILITRIDGCYDLAYNVVRFDFLDLDKADSVTTLMRWLDKDGKVVQQLPVSELLLARKVTDVEYTFEDNGEKIRFPIGYYQMTTCDMGRGPLFRGQLPFTPRKATLTRFI